MTSPYFIQTIGTFWAAFFLYGGALFAQAPCELTISPAEPTVCSGDSLTLFAVGAETYTWTLPGGGTVGGASLLIQPQYPPASVQYVVKGEKSGCPPLEKTVTVKVSPLPVVTVNYNEKFCPDGLVIFSVSPPTDGLTFEWTPTPSNPNANASAIFKDGLSGTEIFLLKVTDGAGCKRELTFMASEDSTSFPPLVDAQLSAVKLCENDLPLSIMPTGATDYSFIVEKFSGGGWTQLPPNEYTLEAPPSLGLPYELEPKSLTNGINRFKITITGCNDKGCCKDITKEFYVLPRPRLKITPDKFWCKEIGDIKDTLHVSCINCDGFPVTYQWEANPSIISADLTQDSVIIHQLTDEETYKTTVSVSYDVNGEIIVCQGKSTLIAKKTPPLMLNFETLPKTEFCIDDSVKINVQTNRSATFVWKIKETSAPDKMLSGTGDAVVLRAPDFNFHEYTVVVTAFEDVTGCDVVDSTKVRFFPSPILAASQTYICASETSCDLTPLAKVENEALFTDLTYSWSPNETATPGVPEEKKVYTVKAKGKIGGNNLSCESLATVTVTTVAFELETQNPDPICPLDSVTLSVKTKLGAPLNKENEYCDCTWQGPNLSAPTGFVTRAAPPGKNTTVLYKVTCKTKGNLLCADCEATQNITVTIRKPPTVKATVADPAKLILDTENLTEACIPANRNGATIIGNGASSYQWTPSAGLSQTQGATADVFYTNQTQKYKVIGTDDFGCKDTSEIVVYFSPLIEPPQMQTQGLAVGQTKVNGTVVFSRWFNPPAPKVYLYLNNEKVGESEINVADGTWSIDIKPLVLGECDSLYAVAAVDGTCDGKIDGDDEPTLPGNRAMVPVLPITLRNAFSPNGDGVNDTFEAIENIDIRFPDAEILIYNRWGSEIYSQKPYKNEWNGAELPAGAYFFILETNKCGLDPFKSHLTILR